MAAATGIVGEFLELKAEADADVLAMQCGDFYEFFDDDAELVARELDLKLSQKSSGGSSYPMAGVPVDDLTPYLRALVDRGYRVAVADQYETTDGHARSVERVVTPGTLIETTDDAATYLASIVRVEDECIGLAFADVTTGQFFVTRTTGTDAAIRTCHRFEPVEIIPGPSLRDEDAFLEGIEDVFDGTITRIDREAFAPGHARRTVQDQFGRDAIGSLDLDDDTLAEVRAAGAIVTYVDESGVGVLPAMTRLTPIDDGQFVSMDVTTRRTLELTSPMIDGGTSLFAVIDRTTTAPGRRRLREWLNRPRQDAEELDRRLDAVGALVDAPLARESVRDHLDGVADIARLSNKATRESADARTLVRIGESLAALPHVQDAIEADPTLSGSPLRDVLAGLPRDRLDELHDELESALRPDPPRTVREGGLIRPGYDAELDEIVDQHEAALEWIDALDARERERHGITHLQVDRNRTDGYYIQVGNSETDAVPEEYREIKTLKQSKRYTTPELEEREREILQLESERYEREYVLFQEVRHVVAAAAAELQDAGRALAAIDAFASLAVHAAEQGWVRPDLAPAGDPVAIEGGRHPVVETTTDFVSNDLSIGDDRHVLLVTGPNMSGKSTYLRQTALIVLLAQIGSFVPADAARIGLVDGIYTRVGALDELSQGRSTFMVEMQELARILHAATDRSLVILDEVGRGTATYDGISIAWAATEFLHNEIEARTLFATHYHELTELARELPAAANAHVAAEERDGDVTFLRSVRSGRANRSYGIHVAALAGVPQPVRERARRVLTDLREDRSIEAKGARTSVQTVFDLASAELRDGNEDGDASIDEETAAVIEELEGTSVAELAPIDIAQRVRDWQDRLSES